MKTRKWFLPVIIAVGIIALCIITLLVTLGVMSANGYSVSIGRCFWTDIGAYLVDEGETMYMSDMSNDKNLFDDISTGDLILVIHDGIDVSYPSRTGAYKVFRLSKGDESDLPKNLDIGVAQPGNAENHRKELENTDDAAVSGVDIDTYGKHTWYTRTNGGNENIVYPKAVIIRSVEELDAYYNANKDFFDLSYNQPGIDSTLGFLDAADTYDESYFENQILVLVLLEEGSGSNRHKVTSVVKDSDGDLNISITVKVPEAGTCDMAQWHLFINPAIGVDVDDETKVNIILERKEYRHSHQSAGEPQFIDDPIRGYCDNTQTTIHFEDGTKHTFIYDNAVTLTDILVNLKYDPQKLCKCLPEYKVDTESGSGYGISLRDHGYVRCDKGQAELTDEQYQQIKTIMEWAKKKQNREGTQ